MKKYIGLILVFIIGGCFFFKTQSPLVSVVIPVYNRETLLPRAVQSILTQTYQNLEVIIVDDGSTDNTLAVAQSLSKQDKRIRVIAAPHQDRWGARNTGLNAANGKYIAFQDSDDVSLPYRIQRQVTYLEKNKHVDVVGSAFAPIGEKSPAFDYVTTATSMQGDELRLIFILGTMPTMQPTIMIRHKFLQKNQICYQKEYTALEDFSLYYQIYEHNSYIANLPEVLYQYKMHGDNPIDYYVDAKKLSTSFFSAYWKRFYPNIKRPIDFCERLAIMAQENSKICSVYPTYWSQKWKNYK